MRMSGHKAGDKATFWCDLGHRLVGSKVLECRLGGEWSSPAPLCQFVDCGPPPEVSNGIVDTVNRSSTFASQAWYSCDDDFQMNGNPIRICQEDGTWSGKVPECSRKFICYIYI